MGKASLAWPTTPLQDGTVWKLSSLNRGSCMNLCRANQNQYTHASSRKNMAALCYLEKKSLFLKQHQRLATIV